MQVIRQGEQGFTEVSNLLSHITGSQIEVGTKHWWQALKSKGAPLVRDAGANKQDVIFLWQLGSTQSELKQEAAEIYIDINGVTDHHSFDMAKLTRFDQTDVCFFSCQIDAKWRGGYSFYPVPSSLAQPRFEGELAQRRQLNRTWFRSIAGHARKDPLNKHNLSACLWGLSRSPLHLPQAPIQLGWSEFDATQGYSSPATLVDFDWEISAAQDARHAWSFSTASVLKKQENKHLPLVLILDGSFWTYSLPIFSALEKATAEGHLPPAVYLFIDEINGDYRYQDLGCNPEFWLALQANLLPQVEQQYSISKDAKRRVVTGQSLGGLAAMYAGLHWPNNFASVLAQSGSFWWPDSSRLSASRHSNSENPTDTHEYLGEMSRLVADGLGKKRALNIFMEVGSQEDIMIDLSKELYKQLSKQEHELAFRIFEGGHERLCWRGGLIDGLSHLLI